MSWLRTVAATLCLLIASPGWSQEGWQTYTSEAYGYRVRYPAYIFDRENVSESDLAKFESADGQVKLTVFAAANSDNVGLLQYRDIVLKRFSGYDNLTYGPVGQNWFVLSGYRDNNIYYQKVMFSCGGGIVNALALTYPRDRKREFDPIVTGIEKSFQPAAGPECSRFRDRG
jgi:hypothetical protein